ncbi:lysine N(6)-hydroxylase/L-ornithine N(5)-oxygenase family protein [Streptomyces natalensis]|uniref:L-lysine N6-monooxygenase MbtG n=1 Tax=Streptomyces natalensis ATCC 27448 TaxID=1240678 RepID=A0A0D7CFB3_9ACTN|nr:SidA/IucD/PvdA family monooxygenase [Streptomyces natalensis]KIZ14878.1 L-lysine 6-monooxygenase [Streptomyces natalensis ATCC 27448]
MRSSESGRCSGSYDVVGLGFGPANLALAIALEEHQRPVTAAFFERQTTLGWHRDMLLPSAKMQVAFMKDLATFRNPTSRFSFVSYLHAKERLARFVNRQDFFPTRREFHDYLQWAESAFTDRVTYGAEAIALRLPPRADPAAPVDHVYVDVREAGSGGAVSTVAARNVVISTGLVPRMPVGIERDQRVWHSSEFLGRFGTCDRAALRRVAVVGAGQSAAEVVRFLYDTLPGAAVYAILPSYGYSIAENTPFANEVFDASAIDDFHGGSQRAKDAIWRYHRNTNYSVVDDEVINDLYQRAYDDEVSGNRRLEFINLSRVTGVKDIGDSTQVTVHSLASDQAAEFTVDLVVFATGYDAMAPGDLLGDLDAYCARDQDGSYVVERDYRLATSTPLNCGLYVQGGTEHTHGLSSSLLSNVAVRGGEIADSIVERLPRETDSTSGGPAALSSRP